ncbi:hypothetical protein GCM10027271_01860 [Saccharopolyspora gloriosae]|uniref:DNA-binding SARP family transcriptional activator n=1 Tax=Saccharopolyspora gloriosae TaxID=455344 RepID=A0A840NQN3_9PSEU|nr:DNA-binding SARP family transcriptional activator [Saccharopolyspora gloriosae]
MAEPDTSAIRYFVLGPVQVRDASGTLNTVNAEKPRLLLAELLLRPNVWVGNDELIEALWAEPPATARGSLKTYVHQLRRLSTREGEESPIQSRHGGYRLVVAPGELDTGAFTDLVHAGCAAINDGDRAAGVRTLRAALRLWRGDPMRETAGTGGFAEVEELRETRAHAQETLAEALIADGRPDEAADEIRKLTAANGLRESAWELLITALRAAGRPAEAVAAYGEARRELADELGIDPGQRLRALYADLLADDDPAPKATSTPAPPQEALDSALPRDVPKSAATNPAQRWLTLPFAARAGTVAVVVALIVAGVVAVTRPAAPPPDRAAEVPPELRLDAIAPKRPVPTYPAGTSENPKLLFGLGPEAPAASREPLFYQAPIGMLTTWYDDPDDLPRFESWRRDLLPKHYAAGTALHLLVAPTFDEGEPVDTPRGPGCGQAYQMSPRFLDDMRRLATSFAGAENGPPLYVSMFNGMEKVACTTHGYDKDPATTNYYLALKDRYLQVRQIFHRYAPNARVALNWDGWQTDGSTPESTARREAMVDQFSDVMTVSDFQSFNAFQDEDNAEDVDRMVGRLSRYGPVMVSNFGPDKDGTGARARSDLERVFAPRQISKLTAQGLFAWSFWDHEYVDVTPETYTLARDVVNRYGLR